MIAINKDTNFVELDPTYGYFSIYQISTQINDDGSVAFDLAEVSVDEYNKENFPEDFENEVLDQNVASMGTFYSSKEFGQLSL